MSRRRIFTRRNDGKTKHLGLLLLGVLLLTLLAGAAFFPATTLVTPPVKFHYQSVGTPERVDSNYLRANVKWILTITTTKAMSTAGYLIDVDSIVNNTRTPDGRLMVVRKNVEIKIFPKSMTVYVPLEKYRIAVTEKKTGMDAKVVRTTTEDVPVVVEPLSVDYMISTPTLGNRYENPFDIQLDVAGKRTDLKSFNILAGDSVQLADGKVIITKHGDLLSDIDIPNFKNLLFFPIGDMNAPSMLGEVRDSTGKRWLILSNGETVVSSFVNPTSPISYNAYFFGNDLYGKFGPETVSWLLYGNFFTGFYVYADRVDSILYRITRDGIASPGTGMAASVYANPLWTSFTFWSYPRMPSLFQPLEGTELDFDQEGSWREIASDRPIGGEWQCLRYEKKAEAFFPWLLKRQVHVYNPTGREPIPREWKVEGNFMTASYPSAMRPQLITIEIDGALADTFIYSPLVSKFKIESIASNIETVRGGQTMKISVNVRNTGDIRGSAIVTATPKYGDIHLDVRSATITLSPGEVGTLLFSAFYGGDETGKDSITFTLKDSEGKVLETREFEVKYAPPIGGLFLGTPSVSGEIGYGKTFTLRVPVMNKQPITFRNIVVRVVPPGGFTVKQGEITKDCEGGTETMFDFQVETVTKAVDYTGTFTIQLIKDGEVVDTVTYNIVANKSEQLRREDEDKPWWEKIDWMLWAGMLIAGLVVIVLVWGYMAAKPYREAFKVVRETQRKAKKQKEPRGQKGHGVR